MKCRVIKAKIYFALFMILGAACRADDLVVTVIDQKGRPLEGAVVYVTGGAETSDSNNTHIMNQRSEKFTPYVLAVSKGDKVIFENSDAVAHHVYSFSDALKLNTVIAGGKQSETFEINDPGIIAIGCNIHDNMAAFVHVAPTSNTAISDAEGKVTLDVPAGSDMLHAWHPRMPRKKATSTALSGGEASITLRVRPQRGTPQEPRRDRRKY